MIVGVLKRLQIMSEPKPKGVIVLYSTIVLFFLRICSRNPHITMKRVEDADMLGYCECLWRCKPPRPLHRTSHITVQHTRVARV